MHMGDAGVVIVNPSAIILDEYRFKRREIELERARLDRRNKGGEAANACLELIKLKHQFRLYPR